MSYSCGLIDYTINWLHIVCLDLPLWKERWSKTLESEDTSILEKEICILVIFCIFTILSNTKGSFQDWCSLTMQLG
jgi:hypothetical protein